MLEFEGLNYVAVIVAALINCAVGAFWYSPSGFGKQWTKLSGVNIMEIPQNEATKTLGFVVVSAIVQAFVLGLVLNTLNVTNATDGLLTGLTLWVGFVAATTVGTTLYQRLSWRFWWLNASYFLVVMAANSVMLALWQ